ncbi:beta-ketoacyl synthase N-terminal-like domain-containing protein [Nocardiopsis sp. RSe5-2]|uniref:Beta-ketoacyl synthase N-terminal-like domain-containing protein n=1 Tax=Nocardiopsis endophytica TaxID=3018445 RepID=A0ABT4U7S2_9ACTN|nr:beta-ketoacyl synthase N-terminal-like domain-containing protein [Nocardiopsis endophytica]MDA2813007.1 beta-ketoacyl synthase N-terminal-like domain-containing protein [Nocardiopsis endophytica]
MERRAIITGIGVVAPTGIGVREHWEATLEGRTRITPFDAGGVPLRAAGRVDGFRPRDHVKNRLMIQTDKWTWFALAAGRLALDDSGFDPAGRDPYGISVVTASASGGNEFGQREIQALWAKGPEEVSAYQSIGWFYAASTGQLSIRHAFKGHCGVVVADGAGGLDAMGQSLRLLRRGGEAVLVGGTEAPLTPYALVCQADLGRLSPGADPERAYRPFAPDADGYVPGEGGAMMLVEEAASARGRGVRGYAEILGHAATHDAHHHERAAPDGRQYARAAELALERAGLGPEDVDAVFADGAGDPDSDRAEAAALARLLGERASAVPVALPKTMVGRLYSGAGALDTAWAALALHHGVLPPAVGTDPDAGTRGLRIVTEPTAPERLRTVLVLARGAGGFNSALVLGRAPADEEGAEEGGRFNV